MAALQAMDKPKVRTQAQREARAEWKERLAAYYSLNAPHKTEQDVELCLDHFEPPEGQGYAEMYIQVQKRFGPEPSGDTMRAARDRIKWLYKLRSYYALVDSTKTQDDIEVILGRFAMEGRSYEELWARVQAKYGVYVDQPHPSLVASARRDPPKGSLAAVGQYMDTASPVLVPAGRSGRKKSPTQHQHHRTPVASYADAPDEYAPGPKQMARALPLREGALVTRHMVIFVVAGLMTKIYRAAGPVSKANFHRAVCIEAADNMNVTDVEAFRVNKITDHIDGSVIEFEFEMPRGWTTEGTGRELVRKVTNGETSIATLRQSYADDLGGNPTRVFIAEAAVMEYHTTPSLRYTPSISGKKPASLLAIEGAEGGAASLDEVATAAPPYPRGVAPEGLSKLPQHAPQLYHTPIGVRRTSPPRMPTAREQREDRETVTPTKRIRPAAAPAAAAAAAGGGGRDVGAISRLIAEPTEASTSPSQVQRLAGPEQQHFDSSGRRIPAWDVIPRPAPPDILTNGPATPRAHQRLGLAPSAALAPATAPQVGAGNMSHLPQNHSNSSRQGGTGATTIAPSSFMQLYQLGEWGTGSGEPAAATRAQLAHAQRGGEL